MANIRDQCSWVHMDEPEKATQKSKDLIRMAVARAAKLKPLYKSALEICHDALVIGGGIAGMTTALSLANQGFKTYLVEREKELGGYVRNIHVPLDGADPQKLLQSLIEQVNNNQFIEVLTDTVVTKTEGFVGNFKTTLTYDGGEKQRLVEHGVIIVATGAKEYRGDDFLLGQTEKALTISDLEAKIANSPEEIARAKDIAMLLCARPEGGNYPYCSRVCCTTAIKNAIKIKELNPEANIYIMYKDIRTYGFKEELYNKARRMGILFLRYTDEKKPELILAGDKIKVDIFDCDLLVTATPMVPSEYNEELGSILKVPLTQENFFHEAHVKLAPNDFASEGIFMCGTAHAPKFIDETITQAQAAAGRAATILSKKHLEVGGAIAVVDRDECVACLTCVRTCPYGVPYIDKEGVATIEAAMCRGCGVCAAECPRRAIDIQHNAMYQTLPKIEALLV
jgi:heterodisulfide reductase subunit A